MSYYICTCLLQILSDPIGFLHLTNWGLNSSDFFLFSWPTSLTPFVLPLSFVLYDPLTFTSHRSTYSSYVLLIIILFSPVCVFSFSSDFPKMYTSSSVKWVLRYLFIKLVMLYHRFCGWHLGLTRLRPKLLLIDWSLFNELEKTESRQLIYWSLPNDTTIFTRQFTFHEFYHGVRIVHDICKINDSYR